MWFKNLVIAPAAAVLVVTMMSAGITPGMWAGDGSDPVEAHEDPTSCHGGYPVALIDAVMPPPMPVSGQEITYVVGGGLWTPAMGVSCSAYDVDVFVDLPPLDGNFQRVCTVSLIVSGEVSFCQGSLSMILAPQQVDQRGLLVAQVRTIGNRHDREDECTIPRPSDPNGPPTPCFDATNTNVILTAETPPEPPAGPACGDVTDDGHVTVRDLMSVAKAAPRSGRWLSQYDLNGDGNVTPEDVAVVAAQLGTDC